MYMRPDFSHQDKAGTSVRRTYTRDFRGVPKYAVACTVIDHRNPFHLRSQKVGKLIRIQQICGKEERRFLLCAPSDFLRQDKTGPRVHQTRKRGLRDGFKSLVAGIAIGDPRCLPCCAASGTTKWSESDKPSKCTFLHVRSDFSRQDKAGTRVRRTYTRDFRGVPKWPAARNVNRPAQSLPFAAIKIISIRQICRNGKDDFYCTRLRTV